MYVDIINNRQFQRLPAHQVVILDKFNQPLVLVVELSDGQYEIVTQADERYADLASLAGYAAPRVSLFKASELEIPR